MIFDLSLALNFSGLSLTTGSNHIYLGHVMAVITFMQYLYFRKINRKK